MSGTHRLPLPRIAVGTLPLEPAAASYVARVLRLRAGDRLEVFEPRAGRHAHATVVDERTIEVHAPVADGTEEAPLVVIQGLPKGDKLGDVVRDATELGATMIIPAACARSVVKLDPSRARSRAERLSAIAAEASRQCGRNRAPEVLLPMPWADALDAAAAHAARRFLLWERATAPLGPLLRDADASAGFAFAIGPEGGLTEHEAKEATERGFAVSSLGPTVLRTETVATAVLGAVRILRYS